MQVLGSLSVMQQFTPHLCRRSSGCQMERDMKGGGSTLLGPSHSDSKYYG